MPEIILVHGLWYRSWSTWLLKWRLQKAGFRVRSFGYSSIFVSPWVTEERLAAMVEKSPASQTHVVGYSLGGLVVAEMLRRHGPAVSGRVLLFGSPINGSSAARRISAWSLGRRVLGRVGVLLQRGVDLHGLEYEIGMIAGSRGMGIGRLSGALKDGSDGTVALAETASPVLADHIEVHCSHIGMLISVEVAELIACFLKQGKFSRE